ncbi:uncharacterized protein LOC116660022 isoform X2 [Camelus ferus]|uniref:Uncharacterized protein LOC116660022 isoform X2 n=1 Tax=Camelus ferus TaxID=419612 RepID=A0A8B8S410_CAMFR|nr:uncharacterized protein LOC116660022 isoform X2 [Camelus ferus]
MGVPLATVIHYRREEQVSRKSNLPPSSAARPAGSRISRLLGRKACWESNLPPSWLQGLLGVESPALLAARPAGSQIARPLGRKACWESNLPPSWPQGLLGVNHAILVVTAASEPQRCALPRPSCLGHRRLCSDTLMARRTGGGCSSAPLWELIAAPGSAGTGLRRIKMGSEKFKKSMNWLQFAERFRIHD